MTTISEGRWFFDQDTSSHNYLVRDDRRTEWNAWLELEDGCDPDPEVARRIDGVEAWTFMDPKET